MSLANKSKFAVGAMFMGAAGYVAGVLTAPKSGKKTRQDVSKNVVKAKTEAEKKLKVLHGELDKLMAKGTSKTKTASAKSKAELNKALKKAKTAKVKTGAILSAIHDGDATDKDLKGALKGAKSAVTDLKKYIKK